MSVARITFAFIIQQVGYKPIAPNLTPSPGITTGGGGVGGGVAGSGGVGSSGLGGSGVGGGVRNSDGGVSSGGSSGGGSGSGGAIHISQTTIHIPSENVFVESGATLHR